MGGVEFGRLIGGLASERIDRVGRVDQCWWTPNGEFDNRLGNFRV